MRRSTWIAVSITAAVLAVAGLASRPGAWQPQAWRDALLAIGATLVSWAANAVISADALARQVPVPVAAGVTIGGGIALVALGVAFRPRRRDVAKESWHSGRIAAAAMDATTLVARTSVPRALDDERVATARPLAKHRGARPRRTRRGRVALDALRFRERLGRA
jgi:hypothetical protein